MERTLVLLKPDAVERGLVGRLIARFEDAGFEIVEMCMERLSRDKAAAFYAEHAGKDFYDRLLDFVTRGPVVVMALQRDDAVERARQIIGATDPLAAAPGSIRGDFGLNKTFNSIHGSATREDAEREVEFFFPSVQ